jgi:hypothetical protein
VLLTNELLFSSILFFCEVINSTTDYTNKRYNQQNFGCADST